MREGGCNALNFATVAGSANSDYSAYRAIQPLLITVTVSGEKAVMLQAAFLTQSL